MSVHFSPSATEATATPIFNRQPAGFALMCGQDGEVRRGLPTLAVVGFVCGLFTAAVLVTVFAYVTVALVGADRLEDQITTPQPPARYCGVSTLWAAPDSLSGRS